IKKYYVALYPYQSVESGDLSFQQDEIILVIKKEGEWWTGVIGDRQGIFPSNYVQMAETEPEVAVVPAPAANNVEPIAEQPVEAVKATTVSAVVAPVQQVTQSGDKSPSTPEIAAMTASIQPEDVGEDSDSKGKGKKPEIATVIAPYQATSSEQLDLQRGQLIMIRKKTSTGWWEGELQAKGKKRQIGWFPASYVKLLGSGGSNPCQTIINFNLTIDFLYIHITLNFLLFLFIHFSEKVIALFQYTALNEDELSFEKDDVITILAHEEPLWWRGELNGVSGLFPSNYVAPLSTVPVSGMEKKRQDAIVELIFTEESYINDMLAVYDVFEKTLRESKLLSQQDVQRIFVNWREIIDCNYMFLRALHVRRDMSAGGIIRMIGDILCENLPCMTAYIRFCSRQLSAAKFLQQQTEESADFRNIVKQCQNDPRIRGMPLSSFLIKPMQRITKYPLLIKKILDYTPSNHPDRLNLQEALAKAEEFCTQVNEGVREKENSDRLEWLQRCVQCEGLEEELIFNSMTNSLGPRKFLHFGVLHKAKSGKELVGFLMNDFLLLAQPPKPVGNSFKFDEKYVNSIFKLYKKPIFLNELEVPKENGPTKSAHSEGSGNDSPEMSRMLRLQDTRTKHIYTMLAPNAKERTLWIKFLDQACNEYLENEKSHLQRQQSKQAQFGACGRILVVVMEGVGLKPRSASVRCRPPEGYLRLIIVRVQKLLKGKQR
ncbi:hypothetical protein L9F63_000427, partial [Diploptera punctata]